MTRMSPRKFMLRWMAQQQTSHVLLESTRAAIDKIAEEFAKEVLADPEFRKQTRKEVRAAMREVVAELKRYPPD